MSLTWSPASGTTSYDLYRSTTSGGEGSTKPAPFSGSMASQSNIAPGEHQHFFYNASSPLPGNTGDKLFAYVYLDPANVPSEIMLQWHSNGSWDKDGTVSRRYMGALPAAGGWVRLEVPASRGVAGRRLLEWDQVDRLVRPSVLMILNSGN
ncbi:hypothetical protein AYO44_11295 [Planctomycetaceae bacterium SCGC AG-212-F19]|nr:hypothetical protein AYO44_11295 [Planctomycetaceae bacterium SCGC AG-212-F19]